MSRSRRSRVGVLKNRADYLEECIAENPDDIRLGYKKAEARAIRWAIPILEAHCDANTILQMQLKEEKDERGSEE